MRAFVIVAVAVVTMLGLGWYFANSQADQSHVQVQTQTAVPASAPEAALGPAVMHPEKDGAQFKPSHPTGLRVEVGAPPHAMNISFEGAELPNGAFPGRAHQALGSHKNGEWNDPKFLPVPDENEVVGRYVHQKMIYPKAPSIARHVPMNDDLLIMEEKAEDRLSATR